MEKPKAWIYVSPMVNEHLVLDCTHCEVGSFAVSESSVEGNDSIRESHERRLDIFDNATEVRKHLLYTGVYNALFSSFFEDSDSIRVSCPRCEREYEFTYADFEKLIEER
jgi:hypothetical protein